MEFLIRNAQRGGVSYPSIVFYMVGIIGIILVFIKPFNAFLFSTFCLAAKNFHAAVRTRSPAIGEFLNLNDLFLWIALFSMIIILYQKRNKIWIPGILVAIFGVVIIADIQSIFRYGIAHQVLRRIWSTSIFPILFLVGANMVQNEKKAEYFFKTFFLGAVFAAMQHSFYVLYKINEIGGAELSSKYRIISYISSGGIYILIGALFSNHIVDFKHYKKAIYYTGLSLIGLSLLFNFTRGTLIRFTGAFLIFPYIIKKNIDVSSVVKKIKIIFILGLIVVITIFPNFHLYHKISQRVQTLTGAETREAAYDGRKKAQIQEIKYWLDGTIILGYGCTIPPDFRTVEEEKAEHIAFYHVAYSTYLSHYGLIGFFIYVVMLPLLTIKRARKYCFRYPNSYGSDISLCVISLLLISFIGIFSSVHFLGATCHIQGILCGVMWGLIKGEKKEILKQNFNHQILKDNHNYNGIKSYYNL